MGDRERERERGRAMVMFVTMRIQSHHVSHPPNGKRGAQLYLSRVAILMEILVRCRGLHLCDNALQDLEVSRK